MKHINITYHMKNATETAETCITLPMRDEAATDLLEKGERSQHVDPMLLGDVYRVLASLSALQGYEFVGFCCAEEVER